MKVHYAVFASEIIFGGGFDGGWPAWLLVLDGKAGPRPSQKQVPQQVGAVDRDLRFKKFDVADCRPFSASVQCRAFWE